MDYTLHQLRIFQKVAHNQSITKASEELFLSQPAVSIQLKKFQDQFSIPLTEVVGRQLYITDFGKEVAEAAENILNQIDELNYKTLAYANQIAGRLRISVVSTGKYVMPYFLADFMKKNKGVDLTMDVTNKATVIKSMEENQVDFSLVSVLPEQLKINCIQLLQNKLYLVGSPKTDWRSQKPLSKIFKEYPLLFREDGSATRIAMETYIAERKIHSQKNIFLTSNEATKQAVVAGIGFSIMPLIGIKNELQNGSLEIIPMKGLPVITNWNLIWLKSKNLSPVARAYLDYITSEKDKIIKTSFDWFERY